MKIFFSLDSLLSRVSQFGVVWYRDSLYLAGTTTYIEIVYIYVFIYKDGYIWASIIDFNYKLNALINLLIPRRISNAIAIIISSLLVIIFVGNWANNPLTLWSLVLPVIGVKQNPFQPFLSSFVCQWFGSRTRADPLRLQMLDYWVMRNGPKENARMEHINLPARCCCSC